MKSKAGFLGIGFFIVFMISSFAQQADFPVLTGSYLGQKPPGMTPEIFAPGIVTTEIGETCPAFSPDGKRFIFMRYDAREWDSGIKKYSTLMTELKNGRWTKPEPLPLNLNTNYLDWDHNFGLDSKTFYFTSKRPQSGKGAPVPGDIWMIRLTDTGWTEPQRLPFPINTEEFHDANPCFAKSGTLYFTSQRAGGYGRSDLYRSELTDGEYREVENLGPVINTEFSEFDLQIAPDESYIVFVSNRPGGHECMGYRNDLYVSFRKNDGSWTEPQNLGEEVNTIGGVALTLTSDAKYLLFTGQGKEPNCDIHWVSTKIIENLKPDELKPKEILFRADRLSERILFIKSGNSAIMSNSTAIATSRGLVVIDAHYKPECGQKIRRIVERAFGREDFAYLIYTHAGVDHMGGASAFPEALLVGHANCITRINGLRDRLKSVDIREILNPRIELLKAKISAGPSDEAEKIKLDEALFYWSELCEILAAGFDYPQPTITFNEDLHLHLGDVTIKLCYCTPGYSESDILIHIPEEKLLVVGDIFNRDRIPLLNEKSDVKRWLDLFEPFVKEKEEVRNIIGGHDEMISLDELKAQYEYLKDLWEGVVVAKKEGLTLEKVKEDYAFNKRYSHLSHLNIRWISTPDNLHERNIEYIWKISEQHNEER